MQCAEWLENNWQNMLSELSAWISFPSISIPSSVPGAPYGKECRRMLDHILTLGEKLGFETQDHDGHAGSLIWKGETDQEIGIFSHLDVVPEGTGWQYEPFNASLMDDKIIGRGSCDDKGPAIAVLYAILFLRESGFRPKHTIRLFFGLDEENGMHDIIYYTEKMRRPLFSFTPDTSFPVCYGEKGILYITAEYSLSNSLLKEYHSGVGKTSVPSYAEAVLSMDANIAAQYIQDPSVSIESCNQGCKIHADGIAAHAAFPEGARSAQVALSKALIRLPQLDQETKNFLQATVLLFDDFYGAGLGMSVRDEISGPLTHVGGTAELRNGRIIQSINVRYPITADPDQIIQKIRSRLEELHFIITDINHSLPHYVSPELPVVQKMTEISNRILGTCKAPFTMGGGTYARHIPGAVGYGPGNPDDPKDDFGPARGRGHQPDEYITYSNLKKAFYIYSEAVCQIDQMLCTN